MSVVFQLAVKIIRSGGIVIGPVLTTACKRARRPARLPVILIAANEFYPFAYVEAPESYCEGLSEDGCQLVWQDVEPEEGGVIP